MLRQCLLKHLQKLDGNLGTETKSLQKKNNYYRHYKKIHLKQVSKTKSKPEKYSCICPVCNKDCNYPSILTEHMRCHEKLVLICERCHKVYKRIDHYTDHIANCTTAASSFAERNRV